MWNFICGQFWVVCVIRGFLRCQNCKSVDGECLHKEYWSTFYPLYCSVSSYQGKINEISDIIKQDATDKCSLRNTRGGYEGNDSKD